MKKCKHARVETKRLIGGDLRCWVCTKGLIHPTWNSAVCPISGAWDPTQPAKNRDCTSYEPEGFKESI
jgi:hypothetical protein